jgi:hypothetical protein
MVLNEIVGDYKENFDKGKNVIRMLTQRTTKRNER